MAIKDYTYNIASDFPNGKVNAGTFSQEIGASSIVTAIERIDTVGGELSSGVLTGGTLTVWFKAPLSTGDKTTLDGDATNPGGGLILAHNNVATQDPLAVEIKNTPTVLIPGSVQMTAWKPTQSEYKRIYMFSCDFNKKETWYIESSGNSESFNANGVQSNFSLAYGSGNGAAIIDLSHGKITEETSIVTPATGSYVPIIKINGAVQNEREMYETSGGNYEIDYIEGTLKFYAAPPSGNTVTIDYFYSPSGSGPIVIAGPGAGKKWIINFAEVQFSKDTDMKDTFVQNALIDLPIFNASGVYQYTLYDYKPYPDTYYYNAGNFLDFTNGSFPIIPPFGGSERGMVNDTLIFRWDYASSMELLGSLNARFKIWTKNGRGYEGERVVITIYGVEHNE